MTLHRILAETYREAAGKPARPAPPTPARDVDENTAEHLAYAGRTLSGPTYSVPPERPADGGWPTAEDACPCQWHPFGGFITEVDPDCPEHGDSTP